MATTPPKNYKPGRTPVLTADTLRDFLAKNRADDFVEIPEQPGYLVRRNQKVVRFNVEEADKLDLTRLTGLAVNIVGSIRRGYDKNDNKIKTTGKIIKACACSSTDQLLCLLEGDDTQNPLHTLGNEDVVIEGDGHPRVQGDGHPRVQSEGGEDNALIYSTFDETCLPPTELTERIIDQIKETSSSWPKAPIVAVVDTGFDFSFQKDLTIWYNNAPNTCQTGSMHGDLVGWNFITQSGNPSDDHVFRHGSQLSALISRKSRQPVKIMPLKVMDCNGIGEIFSFLCALEYLKTKPEVKLVNCSFSYLSEWRPDQGQPEPLFRQLIGSIKDKLFIVAAGNRTLIDSNNQQPLNVDSVLSVGRHKRIFPACFSDLPNVVTVTTVTNGHLFTKVPFENFSKNFVTIGILGNKDGSLPAPSPVSSSSVFGSSYATALLSGMAAYLLAANPNMDISTLKSEIYTQASSNFWLRHYVQKGRYISV